MPDFNAGLFFCAGLLV